MSWWPTNLSGKFAAGRSPSTCGLILAALRFRRQVARHPSADRSPDRTGSCGHPAARAADPRARGQVGGVGFAQAYGGSCESGRACGDLAGLRDAALIDTMSDGLLRAGEAAGLRIDDLTIQPRRLGTPPDPVEQDGSARERRGGVSGCSPRWPGCGPGWKRPASRTGRCSPRLFPQRQHRPDRPEHERRAPHPQAPVLRRGRRSRGTSPATR